MSKSKAKPGLMSEMLSVNLYKKSQGQQVRQVTAIAIAAVFLVAAWSFWYSLFSGFDESTRTILSTVLGVIGCWFAFRITNYPPSADFLIAVQAEMEKVSWPTWPQLWRATAVVLFVMIFLAVSLFVFDLVWQYVFRMAGFLKV